MVLKTIELISDDVEMSIETLQEKINAGEFDTILNKFNFLIMTNVGLVMVKTNKSIVVNSTIDLDNIVETINNKLNLPNIIINTDGNMEVTIDGQTYTFVPQT